VERRERSQLYGQWKFGPGCSNQVDRSGGALAAGHPYNLASESPLAMQSTLKGWWRINGHRQQ
jgi:hypothetical protein